MRSRRAFSLTTSFSRQRVEQSFGIDGSLYPALTPEDFRRLLRLADVGVDIPKPGRFVPVRTLAPLRTKYIQVQSAVHKILAKQAISGTVVILPTTLATEIPGIHLHNSQHWTLKRGKPCGRTIADLSNTPDPLLHCPLNGSTIEERLVLTQDCISLYGPIKLPTIQELLLMVLQVADEHGWESICLWKMDLQGAFNLLWINPDDTPLLAFPLTNDLVVIHLVGIFGWLGMPFAFNVLSRTLLILILAVIKGKAAMYVDDVMGCSALDNIDEDMAATHTAITGLAGDHSIAPDKVERGRSLEFIGWIIDLNSRTITASPRIILKTTHALFSFHVDDRVSQLQLQRLASLLARLSMLCAYMRPFTRHIAIESAQFQHNSNARHTLSPAARNEIWMWRAFILILQCPGTLLHRSIESFRPFAPTFELHYDASLSQIAVGLYFAPGSTRTLQRFAALILPFPVSNDSSRQNTCEYLAIVLGRLIAATMGIRNATYVLFGDSVSSLAWASSGHAASDLALRANLAVTTLSVHLNLHVVSTVHVPGKENVIYDGLSRGKTAEEVGLPPALQLTFDPTSLVVEVITLCNPALSTPSALAIVDLMGVFLALIREISSV